jgi:hypothetical protein
MDYSKLTPPDSVIRGYDLVLIFAKGLKAMEVKSLRVECFDSNCKIPPSRY